jgi:predicted Zn-dependent peptidase
MTQIPKVEKTVLDNGITIVSEKIPSFRSVALGFFVETGSVTETISENGISHFIEHMSFKGTTKRTAFQVAQELDMVGGKINAYTSKENTCYYTLSLDEHLGLALDILTDIFVDPLFDPEEVEKERGVILEEIKMFEDTPDELVHDVFTQTILDQHPLAKTIIGTKSTVGAVTREKILEYRKRYYTPNNLIISAAGNIKHSDLVKQIEADLGHLKGKKLGYPAAVPEIKSKIRLERKQIEQVHLCLGTKGVSQLADDRYALLLLDNILGGTMSSRLFQEIREKRGLVYSVFSSLVPYKNLGLFYVYAAASPENVAPIIDLILKEFSTLKKQGLTAEELERSKEYTKGTLVLGLESTSSRMNWIARSEYYLGRSQTIEEIFKAFDKVTLDDIMKMAEQIFQDRYLTLAVLGDLEELPVKELKL